jgi:hypothetical protein
MVDAVSAMVPEPLSGKVNTTLGQFVLVMVVLSG